MPATAAAARGSAPSSSTTMYCPSIPRLAAEKSGAAASAGLATGDPSAQAARASSEDAARDLRIDFICDLFRREGTGLGAGRSTESNLVFYRVKGECVLPQSGAPPR